MNEWLKAVRRHLWGTQRVRGHRNYLREEAYYQIATDPVIHLEGWLEPPIGTTPQGIHAVLDGRRHLARLVDKPAKPGSTALPRIHFSLLIPLPKRSRIVSFFWQDAALGQVRFARRRLEVRSPGLLNRALDRALDRYRANKLRNWIQFALPAETGRPRILLFTHELSRTGAPIMLAHLADFLRRKGYPVAMVCPKGDAGLAKQLQKSAVPVFSCPSLHHAGSSSFRVLAACDVAVANTVVAAHAAGQFSHMGVPVLWWIHDGACGMEHLDQLDGVDAVCRSVHKAVFPSKQMAELYKTRFPNRSQVIPNGIPDPARQTGPSASFPGADGNLRLLQLGTVCERKGQDVLLQALHPLHQRFPGRFHAELVGISLQSAYAASCRNMAKQLPCVTWQGPKSHGAALRALASAHVLVMPSRDESMPLVILEAMALGRAIVATRVGGVEEMLEDGKNGLVIPPNDPDALAAALARLLQHPELAEQLGQAARSSYVAHHRLGQTGRTFAGLIDSVCPMKNQRA